jgi:hypothetical protein
MVLRGDRGLHKDGHVPVRRTLSNRSPGTAVYRRMRSSGWGTLYAPKFVPGLVAATRAAGEDWTVRQQAQAELTGLERSSIQLTRVSTGTWYLLAGGFLPAHPVRLSIDGKFIATLTANPLGDVTYMISPALLLLAAGRQLVSLVSMLITETARFSTR